MQNAKIKMQNEKEKFKKDFIRRLIEFSLRTVKFAAKLRKDRNLWSIVDQLIDAATSIGANVIEAKSSSSRRDYIKFFEIALKSANETKYWLCLLRDSGLGEKERIQALLDEATQLANMLAAGVMKLKRKTF